MPDRLMSAIEEIHLIELEQGWDDEVACEMPHIQSVCTITVTSRLLRGTCYPSILICDGAARYALKKIADGRCCRICGVLHFEVLPA